MAVLLAGGMLLWPFQSNWSMLAIAVAMLTWLFGCTRTRRATWLVLGYLFAPTILLFAVSFWSGNPRKLIEEAGNAFWVQDYRLAGLVHAEAVGASLFCGFFLAAVTCVRFYPKSARIVAISLGVLGLIRIVLWVAWSLT